MVNVFGNTDFQKREKKEAPQVFPRRFRLATLFFTIFHPCNEFPNVDNITNYHSTDCRRCQNNFPNKLNRNRHSTLHPYVFEVLACWDHTRSSANGFIRFFDFTLHLFTILILLQPNSVSFCFC